MENKELKKATAEEIAAVMPGVMEMSMQQAAIYIPEKEKSMIDKVVDELMK